MRDKLAISFSGGRTSAVMTKLCLEKYKDTHEIVVTFANTGCEHPDTLRFVDACDKNWEFGTVWLEAVVNPNRGGRCYPQSGELRDFIKERGAV